MDSPYLCMLVTAGKFLQALKDFGDVDEETISEAHLRTEYGSVQTQVLSPHVTSMAVVYMCTHIQYYRFKNHWTNSLS